MSIKFHSKMSKSTDIDCDTFCLVATFLHRTDKNNTELKLHVKNPSTSVVNVLRGDDAVISLQPLTFVKKTTRESWATAFRPALLFWHSILLSPSKGSLFTWKSTGGISIIMLKLVVKWNERGEKAQNTHSKEGHRLAVTDWVFDRKACGEESWRGVFFLSHTQ